MKIAIIGSAPSSIDLAPYSDPEWQIWGCSPGAAERVKRADVWFELHRTDPVYPYFQPESPYMRFLAECKEVFMATPHPLVPNSVAYPKREMLNKFGPFFFTSTPAEICALAITVLESLPEDEHKEIGFWGVDMAAHEEYAFQRPGCQFFIYEAMKLGIKITVPGQSDLLMPPAMYGFVETDPMWMKLYARKQELDQRLARLEPEFESKKQEMLFVKGARDDLNYTFGTWCHDPDQREMLRQMMAGKGAPVKKVVAIPKKAPKKAKGAPSGA